VSPERPQKYLLIFAVLALPLKAQEQTPVVVLDFEGYGVSQPEVITLTNRLRNELFKLGTFRVVERGMMTSILAEQDFQLSGCASDECLVEIGRLVGATQAVGGSIGKVGNVYSISARIVDVETGTLLAVADHDTRGDISDVLTIGMPAIARLLAVKPEAVPEAQGLIEKADEAMLQADEMVRQMDFSIPSGLVIGLDRNMVVGYLVRSKTGNSDRVYGVSGWLGFAAKYYRGKMKEGRFNRYLGFGTDVLILPYIAFGGDYVFKYEVLVYVGITISAGILPARENLLLSVGIYF